MAVVPAVEVLAPPAEAAAAAAAPAAAAAAAAASPPAERPASLSVCWPPGRECLRGLKRDYDDPERVSILCYGMQCLVFTAILSMIVAVIYISTTGQKRGK